MTIAQDYDNDKDEILSNPALTRRALQVLNSGNLRDEVRKELEEIVREQEAVLRERGFSVLSDQDKERIREEVKAIPFDRDAEQYFAFLIAEMNTSQKYGQKRSIDPPTTENGLYLQASFVGCGSRREEKSIDRYSRSLAWLQGHDQVNLDHVTQIAPYVLWHRIKWTPETESTFKGDDRNNPLDLHISKELIGVRHQKDTERKSVLDRYLESRENYQRVIDLAGNGHLEQALEEAKEFAADGRGHPIFQDTISDLEGR